MARLTAIAIRKIRDRLIQEIDKILAEMRAEEIGESLPSPWISVKDRLPEQEVTVVVRLISHITGNTRYYCGEYNFDRIHQNPFKEADRANPLDALTRTTEGCMIYILFSGDKDKQGGGDDFHTFYSTREEAEAEGLDYWKDEDDRHLGSWMHLAALSGSDFTVIADLNIPGSEYDETGNLEWIERPPGGL